MQNPALTALIDHAAGARSSDGAALAPPLGVAYSGGADSTALLHAAAACWPAGVQALHVHHGLQTAADAFVDHARRSCEALRIPLQIAWIDARHAAGESPEERARDARYQALAELARAQGLKDVLLAQHADDQVESLLIALGRGAGLDGLAGMGPAIERHGVRFHRPLLQLRAAALRNWLAAQQIAFIEDPSNADLRYTRNRIRRLVLPALEQALPAFRDTFARSARNAARASGLLAELAAADLVACGVPPRIAALRELPRERRANVLRHWLRVHHDARPSEAQLLQLLDQLDACRTRGHRIHLKVAQGMLQREGEILRWYNSSPAR